MVEADFSGSFTNALNCREGDIGVVIGEGNNEQKTTISGRSYMQLNMDIEINQKKLIHSPAMQEGQKLVLAWGKDTKLWIGKKFKCRIVNYKAMGQTKQKVEIEPIEEKI